LRVHRGHRFQGFEIISGPGEPEVIVARCDCGETLDEAEAVYAICPECHGRVLLSERGCLRCAGSGRVVDHAALQWREPREQGGA